VWLRGNLKSLASLWLLKSARWKSGDHESLSLA
jgi:hypothetical protein